MKSILVRLCWNDNGYIAPAGVAYLAEKNSKSLPNYVSEGGFGFEEWNFNKDELVDGMLYGYVRKIYGSLLGKNINVWFYTKSPNNELFLVGCYKNAYVLSDEDRENLTQKMQEIGLLDKRIEQIYQAIQDIPKFSHFGEDQVQKEFVLPISLKLRVDPDDVLRLPEMIPFSRATWANLGTGKNLSFYYHGYSNIPDLEKFERLMKVSQ